MKASLHLLAMWSTRVGYSTCSVSDLAGADETLIAWERGKLHHDLRHAGRIGREVRAQPYEIGQLAGVQVGGKLTGEFALAAALAGLAEEPLA